jgi:hypothetical protein
MVAGFSLVSGPGKLLAFIAKMAPHGFGDRAELKS